MLFMVLSLIFLTISLHKTFDYTRLAGKAPIVEQVASDPIVEVINDSSDVSAMTADAPGVGAVDTAVDAAAEPAMAVNTAPELSLVQPESLPADAIAATEPKTESNSGSMLSRFIFEPLDSDTTEHASDSKLARPITFSIIILLSFVLVLRAVVSQTHKRTMTPLIFVIIASMIVLAAYFLVEASSLPRLVNGLDSGSAK
jgi:hypothetical protein